jgi:hypothetical protein
MSIHLAFIYYGHMTHPPEGQNSSLVFSSTQWSPCSFWHSYFASLLLATVRLEAPALPWWVNPTVCATLPMEEES